MRLYIYPSAHVVFKQREDTLVLFSAMLYECVTQECPEMLPTYIAIEQVRPRNTLLETIKMVVQMPFSVILASNVFVLFFLFQSDIHSVTPI